MFRYTTDKKGDPDLRLTPTDVAVVFGCTYQTGRITVHATGGRTADLRDIIAAASDELKFRLARRLREFGEIIASLILCLLEPDRERRAEAHDRPLFITGSLAYQDGRFRSFEYDRVEWLRGQGESPWMQAVLATWALIIALLGPDAVQPMFEAYGLLHDKRMRIRDGASIEVIDGRIIRAKNTRAGNGEPILAAFLATALDLADAYGVGDVLGAVRRDSAAMIALGDVAAKNGNPDMYRYLPEWVCPPELRYRRHPQPETDNDDDPWMQPVEAPSSVKDAQ